MGVTNLSERDELQITADRDARFNQELREGVTFLFSGGIGGVRIASKLPHGQVLTSQGINATDALRKVLEKIDVEKGRQRG